VFIKPFDKQLNNGIMSKLAWYKILVMSSLKLVPLIVNLSTCFDIKTHTSPQWVSLTMAQQPNLSYVQNNVFQICMDSLPFATTQLHPPGTLEIPIHCQFQSTQTFQQLPIHSNHHAMLVL
jgi:hypothetical protein